MPKVNAQNEQDTMQWHPLLWMRTLYQFYDLRGSVHRSRVNVSRVNASYAICRFTHQFYALCSSVSLETCNLLCLFYQTQLGITRHASVNLHVISGRHTNNNGAWAAFSLFIFSRKYWSRLHATPASACVNERNLL